MYAQGFHVSTANHKDVIVNRTLARQRRVAAARRDSFPALLVGS